MQINGTECDVWGCDVCGRNEMYIYKTEDGTMTIGCAHCGAVQEEPLKDIQRVALNYRAERLEKLISGAKWLDGNILRRYIAELKGER